jgi:DNA-binding NarL/FixJ family response regulator
MPGLAGDKADRFSELVGAIYDCVIDPERWEPTLDALRDRLDCANAILYVADPSLGTHRLQKMVGIDPGWAVQLARHESDLAALHATVDDFYTRSLDQPFVCHKDVHPAAWLANRYYREWAAPQGIVDILNTILMRSPNRFASCAFCRHEAFGLIGDREIGLARRVAPHLRRAVAVSDLIDMRSVTSDALAGALDAIAAGIVIVTDTGEVAHANLAAKRMFDDGAPLRRVRGRLHAADPETTARLGRVIARAIEGDPEQAAASIGLALSTGQAGATIATAHILPLASGDLRAGLLPRAAAAVFVSCDMAPSMAALDAVADAYGLTRSEVRVLGRLVMGEGIAQAAAALNIAVTTTKTHVARLLSKTGSRRQTDLLALVNRLTPAVSAPGPVR